MMIGQHLLIVVAITGLILEQRSEGRIKKKKKIYSDKQIISINNYNDCHHSIPTVPRLEVPTLPTIPPIVPPMVPSMAMSTSMSMIGQLLQQLFPSHKHVPMSNRPLTMSSDVPTTTTIGSTIQIVPDEWQPMVMIDGNNQVTTVNQESFSNGELKMLMDIVKDSSELYQMYQN